MSDLPSVDERPGTYAMFAAIEGDHELAQQLLIEMPLAQLEQFAATAGSLADMAREICRLHGRTETEDSHA